MYKYKILINSDIIGHSNLGFGDAPMGMAFGKFSPNDNYSKYKEQIYKCWDEQNFKGLDIKVQTYNGDESIEYNFVAINDSERDGIKEIELTLNVGYPNYEKLFPNHVEEYNKRFNSKIC